MASLPTLTQEISGFFIIETHVLNTTGDFRSEMEVEELWDSLMGRLCVAVESALRTETDPDVFLKVKECLIGFIMTLEVSHLCLSLALRLLKSTSHPFTRQSPYIPLFCYYSRNTQPFSNSSSSNVLTRSVSTTIYVHDVDSLVTKIVLQDHHLPMHVDKDSEVEAVLDVVWVTADEKEELLQ